MAQSVKRLTSAQIMVLQLVGSSPTSGSGLTAQESGGCFGCWVFLSLCPSPTHTLSVSFYHKNKRFNYFTLPPPLLSQLEMLALPSGAAHLSPVHTSAHRGVSLICRS